MKKTLFFAVITFCCILFTGCVFDNLGTSSDDTALNQQQHSFQSQIISLDPQFTITLEHQNSDENISTNTIVKKDGDKMYVKSSQESDNGLTIYELLVTKENDYYLTYVRENNDEKWSEHTEAGKITSIVDGLSFYPQFFWYSFELEENYTPINQEIEYFLGLECQVYTFERDSSIRKYWTYRGLTIKSTYELIEIEDSPRYRWMRANFQIKSYIPTADLSDINLQ